METRVDLAIIGSGSGNTLISPYWDNKRVAIAESGVFGGTCLNVGCIPTKMLVRPATLARTPEEAARLGITMHTEGADWPAIRDRVFGRIDAVSAAGERYRRDEQEHVQLISQEVRLDGPHAFVSVDGTRVEAEQLVIAAGSRALLPDIPGIDLPQVHTSDTVMRIPELPGRVLVIGGGAIASEFAAVFSGLGSAVTQVHRGPRLLSHSDVEISERFTAVAGGHWELRLERTVARLDPDPAGGVIAELSGGGPADERVSADLVLVALGRRPNSDRVGAAEAGLDLHEDGRLVVDEYQRVLSGGTPVPGVYALGDVCTPLQLKHVANREARVVAHNLEHPGELRAASRDAVPAAIFSDPEVAEVGLTEAEAIAQFGAERVTAYTQDYGDTAYGWAMEDRTGLVKVVADRSDGRILGAHVVGYQASNLIQVAVMAMSFGIDAYTAARGQYWIHPALMEVVENALLGLDVPHGEPAPL
ncbi:mycothione reductase [Leucobacter luti]|uniref:mycothione reductase n=1 Tax=Leucobacter luti TaxID=340320 RepID=UPI0010435AB7|nr:mycothione reductase [Leucobacter luti]MCW2288630.1 mycothione reductase [Leucobacter luti]TCK45213.1 mycothione reductase [Leucobacter luti]